MTADRTKVHHGGADCSTPDRTTAYATAVVEGRIVAGELAIAACKRHLQDLIEGRARGLDWRPADAELMIDRYPANFTITDGPRAGEPFELLDWMAFVTGSLFGWYKFLDDGSVVWRFDEAWVETAKGQGKSPWMATTGVLAIAALGRRRAQVYVTGPKDDQAMVTMGDAAAAVEGDIPGEEPGVTLVSQGKFVLRGVGDNAHKIEHPATRSVFKTKSGNATKISGPRPDIVFVDECHELVSIALIEMWQAALAKNARGGMLICCTNTPATTQVVGTHYSERAQRVVLGRDHNDALFVFITRVDIADRKQDEQKRDLVFFDESLWPKSMPALDITFPRENIRREVAKALLNPSEAARVKRLYMGIPTGAVDFWLDDSTMWDRALAPVNEAEQIGKRCWLALDLSQRHDLTALTIVWEEIRDAWVNVAELGPGVMLEQLRPEPVMELRPTQFLTAKTFYWTCSANLEKRARTDQMPYDLWQANKQINVVDGDSITKDFVAVAVQHLFETHTVDFMVFDVAGMAEFIEACKRIGFAVWVYEGPDARAGQGMKLVRHSQGLKRAFKGDQLDMHTSIDALEQCLRLRTTTIDDSPVTTACAANAAPKTDATGNRAFDKERSRGRIDGLVTLAMAHGAAKMTVKVKPPVRILTLSAKL